MQSQDDDTKKLWEHIKKTADKVNRWPSWKGGNGKESRECPHCLGSGYITELMEPVND